MNKQILIYIKPPDEVSDKVFELNNLISSSFHNDYRSNIDGKWQSHLMLFLSRMNINHISEIIDSSRKAITGVRPFKVTFGTFKVESPKYLFLEIDKNSVSNFSAIHERLVNELQTYRDQSINQKYLDKWSKFSEDEKERIKLTGLPYKYEPHITIARVLPEELYSTENLIRDKSMKRITFEAKTLCIAQEEQTVDSDWKIVGEIKL